VLDHSITQEALAQIVQNQEENTSSTVVFQENWHKGVIGIVASRLIETYHRPTLVFTKSGEYYAASARSVPGFDVYEAKHQKGVDNLYIEYWNKIDTFNNQLAILKEDSTRYKTSDKLLPKLLKEKVVYKRKNNQLEHKSFAYIPKFIRKKIIKMYA
jgi:hypothetical protein